MIHEQTQYLVTCKHCQQPQFITDQTTHCTFCGAPLRDFTQNTPRSNYLYSGYSHYGQPRASTGIPFIDAISNPVYSARSYTSLGGARYSYVVDDEDNKVDDLQDKIKRVNMENLELVAANNVYRGHIKAMNDKNSELELWRAISIFLLACSLTYIVGHILGIFL